MRNGLIVAFLIVSILAVLAVLSNVKDVGVGVEQNSLNAFDGITRASTSFESVGSGRDLGLACGFSEAEARGYEAEVSEEMLACAFTCPTKTGSCVVGVCEEDLGVPPIHACEWPCSGGTYGTGVECGVNMCNGAQCV